MTMPPASLAAPLTASEQIDALLDRFRLMPLQSPVTRALNELIDDPTATLDEVAHVVMMDPTIAMRLLRAVNSAYFGLPEHIADIRSAIQLMGLDVVREIVDNTSILRLFSLRLPDQPIANAHLRGLWHHAVATGVSARIIARHIGASDETTYFAAGLLHDVGKVVLLLLKTAVYLRVVQMAATEKLPIVLAERRLLDFDHAQLGRQLCAAWGQPEEICLAVGRHHAVRSGVDEACSTLAAAVHVADILARTLGVGWWGDRVMPRLEPAARAALDLFPVDASSFMDMLEEEYPRTLAYLASMAPAAIPLQPAETS
jgi:putative nucleotidyltransferase with HDIG domain